MRKICRLRWSAEVAVPELGTSVFIPGSLANNGEERLNVLSRVARSVVESVRRKRSEHVFGFNVKPDECSIPRGCGRDAQRDYGPYACMI